MQLTSPFHDARSYTPAQIACDRGAHPPLHFGDPAAEYAAAAGSAALFDRSDRGLLVARGPDRAGWLHALVSNAVRTLDPHAGNYAFALDQRGRVLFDLNVLCLPDVLWLDIDRAALPAARAHLERYLIIEDVRLADESAAWARLGICGPAAAALAVERGAGQAAAMPALGSAWASDDVLLVRHDFAGPPGFELFVPPGRAAAIWDQLAGRGARPAGLTALDALRIEHGIPWLGRDIDDQVVAPETGQVERAISYHKGCYLGQEIVERMRSHGSIARRLVRVECDADADLAPPLPLRQAEREVGRLTSLVRHPWRPARVGLAYLRTTVVETDGINTGDPPRAVRVLPG